jgi:hypothetical protein
VRLLAKTEELRLLNKAEPPPPKEKMGLLLLARPRRERPLLGRMATHPPVLRKKVKAQPIRLLNKVEPPLVRVEVPQPAKTPTLLLLKTATRLPASRRRAKHLLVKMVTPLLVL